MPESRKQKAAMVKYSVRRAGLRWVVYEVLHENFLGASIRYVRLKGKVLRFWSKAHAERHAELMNAELKCVQSIALVRELREYVASEIQQEKEAFKGYEHCSNLKTLHDDLNRIDRLLEYS